MTFPRTCRLEECEATRDHPLKRNARGEITSGLWMLDGRRAPGPQMLRVDARFCTEGHKRLHHNRLARERYRAGRRVIAARCTQAIPRRTLPPAYRRAAEYLGARWNGT